MKPSPDEPQSAAATGSRLGGRVRAAAGGGPWKQTAIAAAGAMVLSAGLTWYLAIPEPVPSAERLAAALVLLDHNEPSDTRRAARVAEELAEAGYRDPHFAGATEFIRGMAAFRAAEADDAGREPLYAEAARLLTDAEQHAVIEAYRPEWSFALGTSLHRLGAASRAQPLLEEALRTAPQFRGEATASLIEILLDQQTPESLSQALELSESIVKELGRRPGDRQALQSAVLLKARILLALGRPSDADALLPPQIPQAGGGHDDGNGEAGNDQVTLIRAQAFMARGTPEGYREALGLLTPMAGAVGLDQSAAREASYLIGTCHEALDDHGPAVDTYERCARRFAGTHEATAALVRAARLLRLAGRDEEALEAYRAAAAHTEHTDERDTVSAPFAETDAATSFRNRWLTPAEVRRELVTAWRAWVEAGHFAEALSLTQSMSLVIPDVESAEFAAETQRHWAERLDRQCQTLPAAERQPMRDEALARWRVSGRAFEELADRHFASPRYPDTLWTSAEHYRLGEDFAAAVRVLGKFLATKPRKRLPLALVYRGQALLSLDRPDEALAHFRRVVDYHDTDPAAFTAAYLLGVCHLERGEAELAEQAWRTVLHSDQLEPAAEEWRLSLFALGRLLYHTSDPTPPTRLLRPDAASPSGDGAATPAGETTGEADGEATAEAAGDMPVAPTQDERLVESVRRLEEYLARYPQSAESDEARYSLARAYQRTIGHLRRRLDRSEIEAERAQLRRRIDAGLAQAEAVLTELQSRLAARQARDDLDPFHAALLRRCDFELADVEFGRQNYEQAVSRYVNAVNRYPHDPRTVAAYMQMASCYDRLGRPADALSMLQQARVVLKRVPDDAFDVASTNYRTRAEWSHWLEWSINLHKDRPIAP